MGRVILHDHIANVFEFVDPVNDLLEDIADIYLFAGLLRNFPLFLPAFLDFLVDDCK